VCCCCCCCVVVVVVVVVSDALVLCASQWPYGTCAEHWPLADAHITRGDACVQKNLSRARENGRYGFHSLV
jgi:hypothetical protein